MGRRLSGKTILCFALVVAAAGAVAYHDAPANGVTNFDDHWQVLDNPHVNEPSVEHLKSVFTGPYHGLYLPLKLASYMADRALYTALGVDFVRGVHLTNVVLHILNAVLVAVISALVVADLSPDGIDRNGLAFIGLFSGVLFVLHPIHVESVAWLSSRKDVLSFFFMAIAFLVFRRSLLTRRLFWPVACLVLFACGMLSKSTVVCFPLLAATYWLLVGRAGGRRAGVLLVLLFATSAVLVLVAAAAAAGGEYVARSVAGSYATHYLTVVKTFPFYMRKLMFPVELSVIYQLPVARGLADPGVWWGALMLFAQVAVAVFVRAKTAKFIVLWYLFALVPVLQIVPVPVPALAADRYAYIASVPFALAPALIVWRVRTKLLKHGALAVSTALIAAAGIYAGVLGVGTWSRVRVWESSETLWRDCLEKSPTARTALVNLASVYYQRKDYERARGLYEKTIKIDPGFLLAHYRLAEVFEKAGARFSAKALYQSVLSLPSSLTERYTRRYRAQSAAALAEMEYDRGRYLAARTLAARSLNLILSSSKALRLMEAAGLDRKVDFSALDDGDVVERASLIYTRSHRMINDTRKLADNLIASGDEAAAVGPQAAERHYRHAAQVADEYELPHLRLGRLYLAYGEWDAAYEAFTAAFVRGAEGADFEHDYGLAALGAGIYTRAENRLERALELDPLMNAARVKLALAKANLGKKAQALALLKEVLAAEPSNSDALEVRGIVESMGEAGADGE